MENFLTISEINKIAEDLINTENFNEIMNDFIDQIENFFKFSSDDTATSTTTPTSPSVSSTSSQAQEDYKTRINNILNSLNEDLKTAQSIEFSWTQIPAFINRVKKITSKIFNSDSDDTSTTTTTVTTPLAISNSVSLATPNQISEKSYVKSQNEIELENALKDFVNALEIAFRTSSDDIASATTTTTTPNSPNTSSASSNSSNNSSSPILSHMKILKVN